MTSLSAVENQNLLLFVFYSSNLPVAFGYGGSGGGSLKVTAKLLHVDGVLSARGWSADAKLKNNAGEQGKVKLKACAC